MVTITTPEKSTAFTDPKILMARSGETSDDGKSARMLSHTPITHGTLISSDDLRFQIRMMSGMFQKGITVAATSPSVSIQCGIVTEL